MDIAVLSDIHANYEAFRSCVEECTHRGISAFYFLGDYLGDHAYPEKTMDLIYQIRDNYHTEFIRGNKEDYWLNRARNGSGFLGQEWKKYDSTTGAAYYTYERITKKDLEFYESLPISKVVNPNGKKEIILIHGSHRRNREHFNDNPMVHWMLDFQIDQDIVLCGHNHIQEQYTYKNKLVTNAGSVGVSFGAGGAAQFAILHSEGSTLNVETVTLPYEKSLAIRALDEDGLTERAPGWTRVTKHLLTYSTTMHIDVLLRAEAIGRERYGSCNWPDIPEDCWAAACDEMEASTAV
jgi:predicted phosphodiesterase